MTTSSVLKLAKLLVPQSLVWNAVLMSFASVLVTTRYQLFLKVVRLGNFTFEAVEPLCLVVVKMWSRFMVEEVLLLDPLTRKMWKDMMLGR
jgi:hypothetical protein